VIIEMSWLSQHRGHMSVMESNIEVASKYPVRLRADCR
jgi:hypothetical protein